MNIFFIPSWYPSATDSLPGIFFREQALALGKHFEDINVGVSTWGQNDERLLLWAGQPMQSLKKMFFQKKPLLTTNELISGRVIEYFYPEFTWSSKLLKGNIAKIVNANFRNLEHFENKFGKADIIHAHVGYPAGQIARILAERTGVPYIITEQMSPFPHRYFINKKGNLLPELYGAYREACQNIAISSALASDMKSHDIGNIKIIPNLVNEDFFKPADSVNEIFTFFSLGRMVPQKGIDVLLKSFSKMKSNATLRIGGDGEYIKEYKDLANVLKVDHQVVWLGELDKEQALLEYQNCDVFVLPSRHESMGVVFVEAMACGKPVIATSCGGPEEFIDDDLGYVVPPENEEDLCGAMTNMLERHQRFDGGLIRKKFEEKFSSSIITQQLRTLYEKAIENTKMKK